MTTRKWPLQQMAGMPLICLQEVPCDSQGVSPMRLLTLRATAEVLAVHENTAKWIQAPSQE